VRDASCCSYLHAGNQVSPRQIKYAAGILDENRHAVLHLKTQYQPSPHSRILYEAKSIRLRGLPCFELATTMLPKRDRMSARWVVRASTAMISEATAMSKPVSLVMPFSVGACPTVICRKKRSFTSITLFQVMVLGSISTRANLQQGIYISKELCLVHG